MAKFLSVLAAVFCAFPVFGADGDAGAPAAATTAKSDEFDQDKILAAARLASLEYQRGFTILLQDLKNPDEAVRLKAITFLGYRQDPEATSSLVPFLDISTHSKAEVLTAIEALCDIGAEGSSGAIKLLLSHQDPEMRAAAMNGVTRLKSIVAVDYVRRAKDDNGNIRASALTNLGTLSHAEALDLLVRGLEHDSRPHIRRMCAIGLGNLAVPSSGPNLIDALADPDPGVRRYVAEALVKLHYVQSIPALLMALEANVAGDYLNNAVMALSGQNFGFDPHANELERQNAIEKGFVWWAANAKNLGQ